MRLSLALLLALGASAQTPAPPPAARLEDNPQFRAAAQKTFLEYEDSLATHCRSIAPDWGQAHRIIYGKPTFTPEGKLNTGLWSELVPGTACGEPRHFRALVVVRDGQLQLSRQLPGTSNTTPQLERDTRLAVIGAVRVHVPGGSPAAPLDVLDTELVGGALPAAGQSWKELWLVRVSGRTLRVPIDFIPDRNGGGTSFNINPAMIQDVPTR